MNRGRLHNILPASCSGMLSAAMPVLFSSGRAYEVGLKMSSVREFAKRKRGTSHSLAQDPSSVYFAECR